MLWIVAERAARPFRPGVRALLVVIYSVTDRTVKVRFTRSRESFRELSALPY